MYSGDTTDSHKSIFKQQLLDNVSSSFPEDVRQSLSVKEIYQLINSLRGDNLHLLFYKVVVDSKSFNAFPKEYLKELRRDYINERGFRLVHLNCIKEILLSLNGEFEVLVFKGIMLEHIIDQESHKRCLDIDLLIEKRNIKKFVKLLINLGYRRVDYKAHGELNMIRGDHLQLDIHYELTANAAFNYFANFDINKIAKDSIPIVINDTIIQSFDINWSFVHLCMHFGINHRFSNFILVYELNVFLNKNIEKINWDKIKKVALQHNITPLIYISLLIVGRKSSNDFVIQKANDFHCLLRHKFLIARWIRYYTRNNIEDLDNYRIKESLDHLPFFLYLYYMKLSKFYLGKAKWYSRI